MAEVRAVVELTSAVVVRPGDKLVVAMPHLLSAQAADEVKRKLAERLPGVEAVILFGVSQMVVYEPDEVRAVDT